MGIFGRLRFQGYFVHFLNFGDILASFKFFLVILEDFRAFWTF